MSVEAAGSGNVVGPGRSCLYRHRPVYMGLADAGKGVPH
jgi:hypothetical protein